MNGALRLGVLAIAGLVATAASWGTTTAALMATGFCVAFLVLGALAIIRPRWGFTLAACHAGIAAAIISPATPTLDVPPAATAFCLVAALGAILVEPGATGQRPSPSSLAKGVLALATPLVLYVAVLRLAPPRLAAIAESPTALPVLLACAFLLVGALAHAVRTQGEAPA